MTDTDRATSTVSKTRRAEERVKTLLYECTVKLQQADYDAGRLSPGAWCRAELRAIREQLIKLLRRIDI